MTHDELLAKIDKPNGELDAGDPTRHYLLLAQNKALRAVVELHKPVNTEVGIECAAEEDGEYFHPYPCPTVQAIEKELSNE